MMNFFKASKKCAKKRLLECIKADRRSICFDKDKIKADIDAILKKYVEIDGEITLEIIKDKNNRHYITAGAFIK